MWPCVPLLFLTLATTNSLLLQTNVDHVTPNKTENVRLVCKQEDNPDRDKRLQTVNGIRITKMDPFGNKNVFAEIHIIARKPSSIDEDVEVTGSLNQQEGAFLRVQWPVANENTEGAYGCEMDGYDASDSHVIVHAKPNILIKKKILTEIDVINLIGKMTQSFEKKQKELEHNVGALRNEMNDFLQSTQQHIRDKDNEVKTKLSEIQNTMEATCATKSELKDQVSEMKTYTISQILAEKSQNQESLDRLSSLLHNTSSTFEKQLSETTQEMNDFKDQFASSLESLRKRDSDVLSRLTSTENGLSRQIQSLDTKYERLMRNLTFDLSTKISDLEQKCPCPAPAPIASNWPGGHYALPRPETGCANLRELEATGRNLFTTKTYAETGFQTFTKKKSFPEGVKMVIKSDSTVADLKYCVKDTSISFLSSTTWPNGTYCIGQIEDKCPLQFKKGFLTFNIQNRTTDIVVGFYKIKTCCRSDKRPAVPTKFPKDDPFYLYRYRGACQHVEGMTVKIHELKLETGADTRISTRSRGGEAPGYAGGWASVALCYYQPT